MMSESTSALLPDPTLFAPVVLRRLGTVTGALALKVPDVSMGGLSGFAQKALTEFKGALPNIDFQSKRDEYYARVFVKEIPFNTYELLFDYQTLKLIELLRSKQSLLEICSTGNASGVQIQAVEQNYRQALESFSNPGFGLREDLKRLSRDRALKLDQLKQKESLPFPDSEIKMQIVSLGNEAKEYQTKITRLNTILGLHNIGLEQSAAQVQ